MSRKSSHWLNAGIILVALLFGSMAEEVFAGERMQIDIEQLDSANWCATVSLTNANLLAAMTLPFKWGNGSAPFIVDSAVYRETRVEYFAMKTYLVDTLQQTVLIGLISDLGMNYPPLDAGDGVIAKIYFTQTAAAKHPLTLDSTMIPPANTLQLVTPDVRAITPAFDVVQTSLTGRKE